MEGSSDEQDDEWVPCVAARRHSLLLGVESPPLGIALRSAPADFGFLLSDLEKSQIFQSFAAHTHLLPVAVCIKCAANFSTRKGMLVFVKQIVFAGLLSLGLAGAAKAAAPSTGLGQAWPNAPDVSASPHWHAYVFEKDGVRYIQVNDLAGHVRGAFATAQGQYLVLPIGSDAATATATEFPVVDGDAEKVYDDGSTQVTAAAQVDGTTLLQVNAVLAGCDDPQACSEALK
jgi:hypothetical protein